MVEQLCPAHYVFFIATSLAVSISAIVGVLVGLYICKRYSCSSERASDANTSTKERKK